MIAVIKGTVLLSLKVASPHGVDACGSSDSGIPAVVPRWVAHLPGFVVFLPRALMVSPRQPPRALMVSPTNINRAQLSDYTGSGQNSQVSRTAAFRLFPWVS